MDTRSDSAEIERLRAELDVLLYATSHDLAEPARTVRGFLDLLQRRYGSALDDDAREFIGFAVDAAGRLEVMLAGLLELGRIGRQEPAHVALDLAAIAEAAAAGFRPNVTAAGGKLEIGELPACEGDPDLWRRLIAILIDNALTYRSAAPPVIRIDGEAGRITIADNGIGIAAEFHERIFEPFQRLHTRDAIPGVGMGLAIARKIAERQGRRIELSSSPGTGSRFAIVG
ncbi:MAG: hypothetical protein H6852_04595 [Geminicoccaceae bacterium]|nr:hypothetical protein [Geminicoccaceae bacterium]HRY26915.1 ATP-binding protein [Geminicoccaceae bacterium]